jgi:protein TonB
VAVGLLVQKNSPVYPVIAKSARVSGTVVLQATISKTGTIENLHAVSGPPMLRQAALDSVRTWRYKPYRLNNEPVEIETTVNVNFTLGN